MLKKINRLSKTKDIAAVMKQGRAYYSPILMLKLLPNNLAYSRFAVIVSGKVSKLAVKRNLIKRRIREIIRLFPLKSQAGFDLAILASPKIIVKNKAAEYKEIERALLDVFKKAGL